MTSFSVKITSKGQITIPKKLRDRFHLVKGELAILLPSEEGIILKHQPNPLKELRGLMRKEVDLEKAAIFVRKLREEWRIA